VLPRILLGTAAIPGGEELRLFKRGDEFSIMLGANELMNSRKSGSEEALASLACAGLGGTARPRVLIGGLGMGFTLRAALAALPAGAEVVVAELVPGVVAWARSEMAALYGDSLSDARVRIVEEDVARTIVSARSGWDAMMSTTARTGSRWKATTPSTRPSAWRRRGPCFGRAACWRSGHRRPMHHSPLACAAPV
jgi:hypothetical protein